MRLTVTVGKEELELLRDIIKYSRGSEESFNIMKNLVEDYPDMTRERHCLYVRNREENNLIAKIGCKIKKDHTFYNILKNMNN